MSKAAAAAKNALASLPPLGEVPERVHAQVVRQERFGEPVEAFRLEEVPTPRLRPDEVLVAVMAAGINFNNVWAARGLPIDVIATRQRSGEEADFHVGGSDASGIVYHVGSDVTDVQVGDQVLIHHGWWDRDDPWVTAGRDPILAPSARIWGYETNYGAFGQFSVAQAHQCLPKPKHLTWEEAAATLVGTTAYRMLFGWAGNTVQEGDVVLIWGGSGGLGTQAIQLVRHAGGLPVAVVSSAKKGASCESLGAVGWIDRTEFDHWGMPPHWTDDEGQGYSAGVDPASPLGASEAPPGLARHQRRAGAGLARAARRGRHRSVVGQCWRSRTSRGRIRRWPADRCPPGNTAILVGASGPGEGKSA